MPRRPRTADSKAVPDSSEAGVTPQRKRKADRLLQSMADLEHAGNDPRVDASRERVRAQAAKMGMSIVSISITHEAMPDPVFDALPRAERDRIDAISRAMSTTPTGQVAAIERLVAKHPRLPMLRNLLGGAYDALGQRDRAIATIAQAAREFPTYVFAFCNHVLMLLDEGRVAEARAIVEDGPRGPLFHPSYFDPTRDTYHVSEAATYASMVGQYMIATNRREAAKVQLKLLEAIAPDSPQTRRLEGALYPKDPIQAAADLIKLAAAELARREKRRSTKNTRSPRRGAWVRSTPASETPPRQHAAAPKPSSTSTPPAPERGLFEG
jgi:tetratricopeptide (TPR) repeat protein